MSSDASDGRTNYEPDNDATTSRKNDSRDRSGQAIPAATSSNEKYTTDSHKSTERTHRTGLRRVENHASWRAVYAACHVGVGHE